LRVFDSALRDQLIKRMREVVSGISSTFRVESEVRMTDSCPAVVNDTDMTRLVIEVAEKVVGPPRVFSSMRTMGAEDMALFLDQVPGCFFFVGASDAQRGLASPHHSPMFDFDERALDVGVQMLTSTVLEFLED
jgi:amidohydrolase